MTSANGSRAVDRLATAGYALPTVAPGGSPYAEFQVVGGLVHISGQLPLVDGEVPARGQVGADVDRTTAEHLAELAAVQVLGVAAAALGGLDEVRMVQMLVFVASTSDFSEQSFVAGAASRLLLHVLGENGVHARTAIGVAALPRLSPVEIQAVCTRALRETAR